VANNERLRKRAPRGDLVVFSPHAVELASKLTILTPNLVLPARWAVRKRKKEAESFGGYCGV